MSKQTAWTLADLSALPGDCAVEVLDGAPLVRANPLPVHQRIIRRLASALETQLPGEWQLETRVPLLLADNPLDYLCPDLVVFGADVPLTERFVPAASALLVVEVVGANPSITEAYARARIPPCFG